MKLPDKIRIGQFDFKIESWHPVNAQASGKYGEFSFHEMMIRVDVSLNNQMVLDTLLHEINHAIQHVFIIHDDDKEERIVHIYAGAWMQIYRDNPEFMNYLNSTIGGINSGEGCTQA